MWTGSVITCLSTARLGTRCIFRPIFDLLHLFLLPHRPTRIYESLVETQELLVSIFLIMESYWKYMFTSHTFLSLERLVGAQGDKGNNAKRSKSTIDRNI